MLVCQKDYTKTTEHTSIKLGSIVDLGPAEHRESSDPDKVVALLSKEGVT